MLVKGRDITTVVFPSADVKIYLDESLKRFKTVFPACGSANSAIELTIPELEKYSNFISWIDVSTYEDN